MIRGIIATATALMVGASILAFLVFALPKLKRDQTEVYKMGAATVFMVMVASFGTGVFTWLIQGGLAQFGYKG